MFLLSLLMLLYVFGVDSGSLAKRSFCVCVCVVLPGDNGRLLFFMWQMAPKKRSVKIIFNGFMTQASTDALVGLMSMPF